MALIVKGDFSVVVISWIMAVFSLLGAVDLIFGNKFGLGKEFERGFHLLGPLMLSMAGMIAVAPLIGQVCGPFFD